MLWPCRPFQHHSAPSPNRSLMFQSQARTCCFPSRPCSLFLLHLCKAVPSTGHLLLDTPTSSLRQAHSLTPLGNSKGAQAEFKVTYSGAFSYVSSGPCAYFHQGTCHIAFQFLLYMSISSTTLLTPWREELDLLFFYLQANHGTCFLVAAP